jgi:hypothetical protein
MGMLLGGRLWMKPVFRSNIGKRLEVVIRRQKLGIHSPRQRTKESKNNNFPISG